MLNLLLPGYKLSLSLRHNSWYD